MNTKTSTNPSLDDLQARLKKFETEYWDGPQGTAYTRHIALHVMKLAGKLGEYCERKEHDLDVDTKKLKEEIIPDLLYYALGLAAKHDVDLAMAFERRLRKNADRVTKWVNRRDVDGDRQA